MKQTSLSVSGFELQSKRTRRREFLSEMDRFIPWADLVALILPQAPTGKTGRPPFAVETMLRIHLPQQFFELSDPAADELLNDMPPCREFARIDAHCNRLPDERMILRFRHLLERHDLDADCLKTINAQLLKRGLMLKAGTVVDTALLSVPTLTKNSKGERDSEMHQTMKGHQWYQGMKAHIGVDADSGLVHTVTTTAAYFLHGQKSDMFADSGYRNVDKREDIQAQHPGVEWHVAMTPAKRRALGKRKIYPLTERIEKIKASCAPWWRIRSES